MISGYVEEAYRILTDEKQNGHLVPVLLAAKAADENSYLFLAPPFFSTK
jgi:hypothetical protein